MFEAVRGSGYHGDIALDDIQFVSQTCPITPSNANPSLSATPPVQVTTAAPATIPPGFSCNFDTNTCGWTQSRNDDFNWSLHKGQTGSSGTGPSRDHTSGM